jgi:hypothetical protein
MDRRPAERTLSLRPQVDMREGIDRLIARREATGA